MNKAIKILTISLLGSAPIFGQNVSSSDSMKVVRAFKTLFTAIETDDMEVLTNMSTERIYCIICSNSSDFSSSPYMFDKEDFLKNHIVTISNSEELILVKEDGDRSDITVLWTIFKRGELDPGHEGGQFGIYFKSVNGEFKFAGMETIP